MNDKGLTFKEAIGIKQEICNSREDCIEDGEVCPLLNHSLMCCSFDSDSRAEETERILIDWRESNK